MHGGFSLSPGLFLQQRHTICIGARRDDYNSSLQGVDRFTHIQEVDTEHSTACCFTAASSCFWFLVNLAPSSISVLGFT